MRSTLKFTKKNRTQTENYSETKFKLNPITVYRSSLTRAFSFCFTAFCLWLIYFNRQNFKMSHTWLRGSDIIIAMAGFPHVLLLLSLFCFLGDFSNNIFATAAALACPPAPCLCFRNILSCTSEDKRLKLKNIPALDSAADFSILDFRGNSISKLKGATWAQYQNAAYLNLKHNNLTEVNKLSFAGLFKLKYLFLSDNQIMFMTSYAFEPLLHIQLIDLSNNQLIGIQDDLFKSNSGFPYLKVLDLSNNHIVTIGCDAFGMLSQLLFLDIHTSQISIKTLGVILHKTKSVINLYLSHASKCCLCMFPSHARFYLSRTLELDCKDLKCEITLKKCYPNEENSLESVRPSCNQRIPEKTPNMNESKSLFRRNDFNYYI
ncbi:leucine-rich repeat-containing protein 37A-like isoform X3 [Polyodon spathula]|uniref:leucine-rich repeat-containing protein 37A-like isoform X3 n=1 Tax=Polyodon spathula TaxID=7913 RepID=UPI001B7E9BD9|nr:leucine-rich repeat-containing protein 37A-like isoform X3 [Polyodon spathula]